MHICWQIDLATPNKIGPREGRLCAISWCIPKYCKCAVEAATARARSAPAGRAEGAPLLLFLHICSIRACTTNWQAPRGSSPSLGPILVVVHWQLTGKCARERVREYVCPIQAPAQAPGMKRYAPTIFLGPAGGAFSGAWVLDMIQLPVQCVTVTKRARLRRAPQERSAPPWLSFLSHVLQKAGMSRGRAPTKCPTGQA